VVVKPLPLIVFLFDWVLFQLQTSFLFPSYWLAPFGCVACLEDLKPVDVVG
jgi:hypothetical protein